MKYLLIFIIFVTLFEGTILISIYDYTMSYYITVFNDRDKLAIKSGTALFWTQVLFMMTDIW